jgi:hypothetical protein
MCNGDYDDDGDNNIFRPVLNLTTGPVSPIIFCTEDA